MSIISDMEYIKRVCKAGSCSNCCAYLAVSTEGFCCAKEVAALKNVIDSRVAAGTMNAKGDNCQGYQTEKAKIPEA